MTTSPSSCLAGHSQPRILEHLLLPSSRGLGPIPEETASSFSSSSSHLSPSTEPATEDRRDDDLDKKDPTHGPSTNDPDIPERQTPIQEEKGLVELSCATAPANDENNDAIHGPLEPYHVFSRREKWCAVWIVSLAGLFSPLSSNIYFPALGDISLHTNTSLAAVSLTITTYMAVQGLAPSIWGPLSDTRGRRLTFIGTFVVYLIANVGLAVNGSFAGLMVFRALQAFGGAATISVGAGVIGDITTPKERGGFMGSFGGIRMVGQSIGPVIGGIITEFFGFHAIFWFLAILGSISLLLIVLFLPETLRSIAGNGSVPLEGINRPLVSGHLRKHWKPRNPDHHHNRLPGARRGITLGAVFSPLRFLFEKDVFVTLLFGGVVYAIWSMVTSSTAALFQPRFGLTDLQVGLVFLPNGAACVSGSYVTGKILDRDYGIVEDAYRARHSLDPSVPLVDERKRGSLPDFPVGRARLRSSWCLIVLFVAAVAGYGFAVTSPLLERTKGMIVLPLLLQFVIAFTATAVFTQNSALMVDLYPGAAASATAVNNLMRCALGAVGVAGVQFVIDRIGAGVTFLMLAGVAAAMSPLMVLQWIYGESWRAERMLRMQRNEGQVIVV
ncbi:major facilitator superfamily domain-containing protein [Cladorrhinum samala]|uniref:Major facilitator superfamily domain-containing protein n=1 Tax=Cladorrhinum samala TaxID=585594 RepID=A0AAV9HVW3_9PEZI|nr:major facilitator superfamily domain-containing protein [Cladorrhinum samala]